ncbi:hypothetical protein ACVILJ_000421 [Bradyrhizobium diazoefficiens]
MGVGREIYDHRENVADTTSAATAARGTAQHFRDARSERIAELLTCRHILAVAIEAPHG